LFAQAADAAGTTRDEFDAATVDDLLDQAVERYGDAFAAVLDGSRVWLNGDTPVAGGDTPLALGDEVAVLPPVSGG
jgi:molybdopterin converting factor small subunit